MGNVIVVADELLIPMTLYQAEAIVPPSGGALMGEYQFPFDGNSTNIGSAGGAMSSYGGSYSYQASTYGQALHPDTATSGARSQNTSDFRNASVFTFSCRLMGTSNSGRGIVASTFNASGGFQVELRYLNIGFQWYNAAGTRKYSNNFPLTSGVEHHYLVRLENGNFEIYIDGVLRQTIDAETFQPSGAAYRLNLGFSSLYQSVNTSGITYVDNYSWYARSLTLSEMQADQNNYLSSSNHGVKVYPDECTMHLGMFEAIAQPPLTPPIQFKFEGNYDNTGAEGGSAYLINADDFSFIPSTFGTAISAPNNTAGLKFDSTLMANSPEFTLCLRLTLLATTSYNSVIDCLDGADGFRLRTGGSSGLIFQWYNSGGATRDLRYVPPLNQEIHIVIQTKASINGLIMYVDGVEVARYENETYAYQNASSIFAILCEPPNAQSNSDYQLVDNVGFYPRELSIENINTDGNNYEKWDGSVVVQADSAITTFTVEVAYLYQRQLADELSMGFMFSYGEMVTDVECEPEVADRLGDGTISHFLRCDSVLDTPIGVEPIIITEPMSFAYMEGTKGNIFGWRFGDNEQDIIENATDETLYVVDNKTFDEKWAIMADIYVDHSTMSSEYEHIIRCFSTGLYAIPRLYFTITYSHVTQELLLGGVNLPITPMTTYRVALVSDQENGDGQVKAYSNGIYLGSFNTGFNSPIEHISFGLWKETLANPDIIGNPVHKYHIFHGGLANVRLFNREVLGTEVSTLSNCIEVQSLWELRTLVDAPLLELATDERTAVVFDDSGFQLEANFFVPQPIIITMPVYAEAFMLLSLTVNDPLVETGEIGYSPNSQLLTITLEEPTIDVDSVDGTLFLELFVEVPFYSGNLYRKQIATVTPKSLLISADVFTIDYGAHAYVWPKVLTLDFTLEPISLREKVELSEVAMRVQLNSPVIKTNLSPTIQRIVKQIDDVRLDGFFDFSKDQNPKPNVAVISDQTIDGSSIVSLMSLKPFNTEYEILSRQSSFISYNTYSELSNLVDENEHTIYFSDGSFEVFKFDLFNKPLVGIPIYEGADYIKIIIGVLI